MSQPAFNSDASGAGSDPDEQDLSALAVSDEPIYEFDTGWRCPDCGGAVWAHGKYRLGLGYWTAYTCSACLQPVLGASMSEPYTPIPFVPPTREGGPA